MPGRKGRSPVDAGVSASGPGDFHAFLARNLPDAYRLAVIATGDPIAAGAIVRAASVDVWRASEAATAHEIDGALRRRLESDLEAALEASDRSERAEPTEPLDTAIRGLTPRRQIELARAFAPAGADMDPAPVSPADLGLPLRALYESRDPGDSPPLQLRLQLDEDRRALEGERTEQARRVVASGWRFVINAGLALGVITLVLALASLMDVRASAVTQGDPTLDPPSPLRIAAVSLVQGGIDGGPVHIGGTQRSLVAAFPPSAVWHSSERACDADVLGSVDWTGQATWVGAHAGHATLIAGDPSSQSAYVAGLGAYCEPSGYLSKDGGLTWGAATLPGDSTSIPSWLAFDPSQAGLLLACSAGVIYESPNSGMAWTRRGSGVTPLGFDSSGRLVGWTQGRLYQSLDDGTSWQQTGVGPTDPPLVAGATGNGVLIGTNAGLWWYPLTAAPSLLHSGRVFAIATLGGGAVVLGADSAGHPWLGTTDDTQPGISPATLPNEASSLTVTGGEVAVNDAGALVAFSGSSSLIALATFAR